jgi:hypothetical protein
MKRIVIPIIALLILSCSTIAQGIDPIPNIPVPQEHSFDCQLNPDALYFVGPNCISPVLWDIEGLHKIGGFIFFDGGAGPLVGFVWNWHTQSYDYLILTNSHDMDLGYAGNFQTIDPKHITYP